MVDTPAGVILVIGDVAGKGAAAAALSAVSRVTLRTAARLTGDARAASTAQPRAAATRRAQPVHGRHGRAPPELPGPATVLLAGHPAAARARGCVPVGNNGPLLGAVEAADWPPAQVDLRPGGLVLYTDGVLDAALPDGARFGEARLNDLVAATGGDPGALMAAIDTPRSRRCGCATTWR